MENGNLNIRDEGVSISTDKLDRLMKDIKEEFNRYICLCDQLTTMHRVDIKDKYDIRLKANNYDFKLGNITMGDIASIYENKVVNTRIKLIEKMQGLEAKIKNDKSRPEKFIERSSDIC